MVKNKLFQFNTDRVAINKEFLAFMLASGPRADLKGLSVPVDGVDSIWSVRIVLQHRSAKWWERKLRCSSY